MPSGGGLSTNNSNGLFTSNLLLPSGLGAGTVQAESSGSPSGSASDGGSGRKSMNGSGVSSVRIVSPPGRPGQGGFIVPRQSKRPLPLLSRKDSSPRVNARIVTTPLGVTIPSDRSVAVAT